MSLVRNNRRRYRRRPRFGFLYKMLAVAAVLTALVMGATVFFRVEEVEVTGNERYPAQQVIEVSGVVQGDNLFGINKFDTARKIRRQLPYVEGVNIRRKWPDRLIINVTESNAAARLAYEDGHWLISKSGKVLEFVHDVDENIIHIGGLNVVHPEAGMPLVVREEQQLRGENLLEVLQALDAGGVLNKVSWIDLSSPVQILMDFDSRFAVKLPVGGDFAYLLGAMNKAVGTLEEYEAGTLDLTVKDYTVIFSPA